MALKHYADTIVEKLKGQGFVIQRYDAYSTSSIYLKLDYGVCNTIRISDHEGKEYLQYRYNLIIGGEDNIIEDKYMRYYYNENSIKAMLMQILLDRQEKLQKYGKERYRGYMVKNMNEHKNDRGFWHGAKLVTHDIDVLDHIATQRYNASQGHGYRATQVFVDEDVVRTFGQQVTPEKIEDGIYAIGPQIAIDLTKQVFANQHQLDNSVRFKPGDKVKVTVSFRELVRYFMTCDETDKQAETHALQILGKAEYNVGTNLGATKCDEGIFYTIEFPLVPMEFLPEDFLDRV